MLSGCHLLERKRTVVVYRYMEDSLLLHPCKEDYREVVNPTVLAQMYVNNTTCLRKYKQQVNSQIIWKQKQKELDKNK